jgi:hypothetical protein
MMKYCFLLLSLFSLHAHAQIMSWTSCSVNTDIEYTLKAMSPSKKEVCVGGPSGELSYRTEAAGLFKGTGELQLDEYEVSRAGSYLFVYDFSGTLKWHYYEYTREERLDGVCYDYRDRLTALMLRDKPNPDNGYYGEEPEEEEDEEEEGYCYTLCRFDQSGYVVKEICITDLLDVEITDFKSHPDGGFIIAGHADEGKFTRNLTLDAGRGGSDFLVYVDSTGKVIWGDALAYQKSSCCTYGSEPEVAVDSKGNVIIAGAYVGGARFGGSQVRLAQVPYNAGQSYTAMEAYVASYSAAGKFRWVQTAVSLSTFCGLAAGNGNIYVGTRMSRREGNMFGTKVDTAAHQSVFVTIFDESGKVQSNISTGSASPVDVAIDQSKNLVITGVIAIETGFLARPESEKAKRRLDDVYVAFYSPSGKFITHHTYNLLKISSDHGPFCLPVSKDEYYLGGQLWGALPISLHILNPAFPDKNIYGGGTFLARCISK